MKYSDLNKEDQFEVNTKTYYQLVFDIISSIVVLPIFLLLFYIIYCFLVIATYDNTLPTYIAIIAHPITLYLGFDTVKTVITELYESSRTLILKAKTRKSI